MKEYFYAISQIASYFGWIALALLTIAFTALCLLVGSPPYYPDIIPTAFALAGYVTVCGISIAVGTITKQRSRSSTISR